MRQPGSGNLYVAMINIELSNQQEVLACDLERLGAAARLILETEGITSAELSVAVVDDEMIHQLNRQYLDHDYATDVLSFVFDEDESCREGEVIVSADTAERVARGVRARVPAWTTDDELLLYVIHGTLHFVGLDDRSPELRAEMRERERFYLRHFGLEPPEAEDPGSPDDAQRSARFSRRPSAPPDSGAGGAAS